MLSVFCTINYVYACILLRNREQSGHGYVRDQIWHAPRERTIILFSDRSARKIIIVIVTGLCTLQISVTYSTAWTPAQRSCFFFSCVSRRRQNTYWATQLCRGELSLPNNGASITAEWNIMSRYISPPHDLLFCDHTCRASLRSFPRNVASARLTSFFVFSCCHIVLAIAHLHAGKICHHVSASHSRPTQTCRTWLVYACGY